jgi:hypothetical protein
LLDRTLSHVGLAARKTRRIVERLITFRRFATLLADITRDRLTRPWWESALGHY